MVFISSLHLITTQYCSYFCCLYLYIYAVLTTHILNSVTCHNKFFNDWLPSKLWWMGGVPYVLNMKSLEKEEALSKYLDTAKLQRCTDQKADQLCLYVNLSKQNMYTPLLNIQSVLPSCHCGGSYLSGEAVGRAKQRQAIWHRFESTLWLVLAAGNATIASMVCTRGR